MLLLNRTLLQMAKGLWRWIFLITALKLAVLAGLAAFAGIISGFLGNIASPAMTVSDAGRAVLSALLTAAAMHRRSGIPLYGQSPPDPAHRYFFQGAGAGRGEY